VSCQGRSVNWLFNSPLLHLARRLCDCRSQPLVSRLGPMCFRVVWIVQRMLIFPRERVGFCVQSKGSRELTDKTFCEGMQLARNLLPACTNAVYLKPIVKHIESQCS
jgi:hypothetical protein